MLDGDDDLNTGIPKEPEPICLQTLYLSETTKPGLILTFPDAGRCIDASGGVMRFWCVAATTNRIQHHMI